MTYFLGIDIGSSFTKAILMDQHREIEFSIVKRTHPRHRKVVRDVEKAIQEHFEAKGRSFDRSREVAFCVGTGYGRENIDIADTCVTEIACHARGAFYLNPKVRTIIDIGGQDAKIIRLDDTGNVINFVMNEKCAAGTGRFLELTAKILKVPVNDFGEAALSVETDPDCRISSTCVVFAQSEIISKLSEGVDYRVIIRAVHEAVIARVIAMGRRLTLQAPVTITGGLADNIGLADEVKHQLELSDDDLLSLGTPKIAGAIGAALCAEQEYRQSTSQSEKNS